MKKVTKKWTTASGERIRICDMDDRHLVNSIRMLQRHARENPEIYVGGGIDSDDIWCDCDQIEGPEDISPLYDDLVNEAVRRKLPFPKFSFDDEEDNE